MNIDFFNCTAVQQKGQKFMKLKKITALLAALMLCAGTMTACADKSEELLRLVDAGDFKGAYDYYDEEIDGTNKEDDICDEFADEMEDRYEDITDKCFEGEYDEDDIEDLVELLEDTDVDEDDYEEYYAEWQTALMSKQSYEDALDYMDDGDYSLAASYFELVDERDSNYEDAMEKIEECQVEEVGQYLDGVSVDIENGYYDSAVSSLDYYREEYADNEAIMERIEELDAMISDEVTAMIMGYIDDEDFYYASYYLDWYSEYLDEETYADLRSQVYYSIPDVSNLSSEAAVLTLNDMGFLTTISNREDNEVSTGYVISTEPAANTEIRRGETVVIYVSSGSADSTAIVPNVVGYDYEYAATALEGRGFVVSKIEADSNEEAGIVIGQSIDAYDVVDKETEIVLTVSSGVSSGNSSESLYENIIEGIHIGMTEDELKTAITTFHDAVCINVEEKCHDLTGDPCVQYRYIFADGFDEYEIILPSYIEMDVVDNRVVRVCIVVGAEWNLTDYSCLYPYDNAELGAEFDKAYAVLNERFGEGEDMLLSYPDYGYLGCYEWSDTVCGNIGFVYGTDLWMENSGINEICIAFTDSEYYAYRP